MADLNFNNSTRKASTQGTTVIEVYDEADFGATAQVRTIAVDTEFYIQTSFSHNVTFTITNAAELTFIGPASSILTYTGIGNFINSTNAGPVTVRDITISGSGDGKFIDIIDSPNAVILLNACNIINFAIAGEFSDGFIFASQFTQIADMKLRGFTLNNVLLVTLSQVTMSNSAPVSGLTWLSLEGTSVQAQFIGMNIASLPGENSFFFSPDIKVTGTQYINTFNPTFGGNFFEQRDSGTVDSIADASDSGTINSVADGGSPGTSTFTTASSQDLATGRSVTLSGFTTNTAYNGTFNIIDVPSATQFTINVAFGTTETGSWSAPASVLTITGTAPGETDGVLITNTANYNGGFTAFNISGSTFQISKAFTITETGNYNLSSLDQTDPRISVSNVDDVPSSKNIGSVHVTGNAIATVINTQAIFEDLNYGTALKSSNIEEWQLINTVNGELRYEGLEEFRGSAIVAISATSAGGTQTFDFRLVLNGSVLTDDVKTSIAIGSDLASTTLVVPLVAVTNDTIKVEVANTSGTSNLTAVHVSLLAAAGT